MIWLWIKSMPTAMATGNWTQRTYESATKWNDSIFVLSVTLEIGLIKQMNEWMNIRRKKRIEKRSKKMIIKNFGRKRKKQIKRIARRENKHK